MIPKMENELNELLRLNGRPDPISSLRREEIISHIMNVDFLPSDSYWKIKKSMVESALRDRATRRSLNRILNSGETKCRNCGLEVAHN